MKQRSSLPIHRFEIYWVNLDPTVGHEVRKTRPCVIISPKENLQLLHTVLVAPITSKPKHFPFRVATNLHGAKGEIMLDQIRGIDKSRLAKKIGIIDGITAHMLCATLQEMFAY